MARRPNVIIFGGMESISANLVHYLVPEGADPLVGHLLLIDKYSIFPPTTFVPKKLLTLFSERPDLVEYAQGNLQNQEVVRGAFDHVAPNGRAYEYVFDFSGDLTYDRPSGIHIAHTFKVALTIAQEASKRNVKAYIRILGPFYNCVDLKKRYKEEDARGWKPWGKRGVWWLEMIRAIGSIQNLPLVVLRCGAPYGPGIVGMEAISNILIGLVYKALGRDMKFLWSPKLPKNTVHVYDVVAACWKAAEWISTMSRESANSIAGVPVPPSGDKEVETVPDAIQKSQGTVVMPLFNVVDDSDTTQESMAKVVGKVYGIKVGFHGSIISTISGLKMNDVVEDINEMHMEQWTKTITTSSPPVPSTPLSPYAQSYILEEHGYAMDGDKIKKVLGLRLKHPHFEESTVREFIDWCRHEGIWPESPELWSPVVSP